MSQGLEFLWGGLQGRNSFPWYFQSEKITVKVEVAPVRAITLKRGDRDRFTCNWGHFWHDNKCPGYLSVCTGFDIASTKGWMNAQVCYLISKIIKPLGHNSRTMKISALYFVFFFHTINLSCPNNKWNNYQRHSDRCDSFAPYYSSTLIKSQSLPKL